MITQQMFSVGPLDVKFDGQAFPIIADTMTLISDHNLAVAGISDEFRKSVETARQRAEQRYLALCAETVAKLGAKP